MADKIIFRPIFARALNGAGQIGPRIIAQALHHDLI
jgi:hypothetical protein